MASSKVLLLVFTVFLLSASLIHCENEDTDSKAEPSDGMYFCAVHSFSHLVGAAVWFVELCTISLTHDSHNSDISYSWNSHRT